MIGEVYFLCGFWYFCLCIDYCDVVICIFLQDVDLEIYGLFSGDEVLEQVILDFKEVKFCLFKFCLSDENGCVI